MDVTINLGTLLCLLIIAGIILVVYLIIAAYNLIKTLKQSQKVLGEFEVVAHIASERTQQLDKLIEKTAKTVKSGQGVINSIPVIMTAISKIAQVIGKKKSENTSNKK